MGGGYWVTCCCKHLAQELAPPKFCIGSSLSTGGGAGKECTLTSATDPQVVTRFVLLACCWWQAFIAAYSRLLPGFDPWDEDSEKKKDYPAKKRPIFGEIGSRRGYG